jgi:hypothetical protein
MELAIVLGVVAFLLVGAFTSVAVLHDPNPQSGLVMGVVAALWVALPCLNKGKIERENVLRPAPRRYPIAWKFAFAKVRDIFARANYRTGTSRWNVGTADTQAKHIHATMHFTDEKGKLDGAPMGTVQWKSEFKDRFIEVDIQFFEHEESCVMQVDFRTQIEGVLDYRDADFVIQDIKGAIERELGPGTPVAEEATFNFEPPPWWLIGITAAGLLTYASSVVAMLFQK